MRNTVTQWAIPINASLSSVSGHVAYDGSNTLVHCGPSKAAIRDSKLTISCDVQYIAAAAVFSTTNSHIVDNTQFYIC